MTQTYKVQVSMNQAHIVESGFVWKQGDFGFNIEIEVLDFDTTGATPQIIFRKSTGAVEATQISVAGNKFTYAIRGTELDTPGPCVCDLKLKDSTTKRVSTASFKYFVIPDTMDGLEQEASSYSDTIAQLIAAYDNNLAPDYSTSATYNAGDYVIYNKHLYRAKIDIDTAETWTGAHWQLVTIGNETIKLKSALSYKLEYGEGQKEAFKLEHGDINSTTGAEQSSYFIWRSDYFTINGKLVIDIPENHQFLIFKYLKSDGTYLGDMLRVRDTHAVIYGNDEWKYRFLFTKNPVALPDPDMLSVKDVPLTDNEIKTYYVSGGLKNTGEEETNNGSYRSDYIQVKAGNILKYEDENSLFEYRIYTFDTNQDIEYRLDDVENKYCYITKDGYIRCTFKKRDNSGIQNNYAYTPTIYLFTDYGELLENQNIYHAGWAQGSISGSTGQNENQPNVIRTGFIDNASGNTFIITNSSGFRTKVYYYNNRTEYLGCDDWDSNITIIRPTANSIRVLLSKNPYSAITPEDGTNAQIYVASLKNDLGNKITNNSLSIDALKYKLRYGNGEVSPYSLELGDINTSTGAEQVSSTIYRSGYFNINGKIVVNIPANHFFRLYMYNGSDVYQGYLTVLDTTATIYGREGWKYRFLFSKYPIALPDNPNMLCVVDVPLANNEAKAFYVSGGIKNTGEEETNNGSYRSDYIQVKAGNILKYEDENSLFEYRWYTFDTSKNIEYRLDSIGNKQLYITKDGFVRCTFRKLDSSGIQNNFAYAPTIFLYEDFGEVLENQEPYYAGWAQGSISGSTGQNENQPNVIRTGFIDNISDATIIIKKETGYRTRVYYYNGHSEYVGLDDWDKNTTVILRPRGNTIRILLAKDPYSAITPSDSGNAQIIVAGLKDSIQKSVYSKTDTLASSLIKSNLMNGVTISEVTTLNTIVGAPSVAPDGTVYVGAEVCETEPYESSNDAFAKLYYFNIIDPYNVESYTVIERGDVLPYINPFFGTQETIQRAWDTIAVYVSSTKVRVITKIFTNTTACYLVYRDFNPQTKTFGDITVMNTVIDGTSYVMWGNNNSTIRELLDLQLVDPTEDSYMLLLNCRIVDYTIDDTKWYYTDISYGYKSSVLMKSTDLENWVPVGEIPIPVITDEMQTVKYDDMFYIINRANYNNTNDLYVQKFDPLTETFGDRVALYKPSYGNEKPCVEAIDGNLYINQCIGNITVDGATMPRSYDTYIKFDLKQFKEVRRINVKFDMPVVYPEFFKVGRTIYMIANTDRRGYYVTRSDGRQEMVLSYFDYHILDIVGE